MNPSCKTWIASQSCSRKGKTLVVKPCSNCFKPEENRSFIPLLLGGDISTRRLSPMGSLWANNADTATPQRNVPSPTSHCKRLLRVIRVADMHGAWLVRNWSAPKHQRRCADVRRYGRADRQRTVTSDPSTAVHAVSMRSIQRAIHAQSLLDQALRSETRPRYPLPQTRALDAQQCFFSASSIIHTIRNSVVIPKIELCKVAMQVLLAAMLICPLEPPRVCSVSVTPASAKCPTQAGCRVEFGAGVPSNLRRRSEAFFWP